MTDLNAHPDERLRNLRKLQLCELEILEKIKSICEEYNLTYYLSGGTLLGAVRHKGFIPWDDDVDVAMPRPDYEKFVDIAKHELVSPFYLSDFDLNRAIRVLSRKMQIRVCTTKNKQIRDVWVDVMPLDTMPRKGIRFILRKYHLLYRRMMLNLSTFKNSVDIHNPDRTWYEKLIIDIAKKVKPERFLNHKKEYRKFHRALRRYSFEKGPFIINMVGKYKFLSLMDRNIYGDKTEIMFEGELYSVPEKYDIYLKRIYGNYMVPPAEDRRNDHMSEIVSIKE